MYKECIDIVGGKIIRYISDDDTGGCWVPVGLHHDKDGYNTFYYKGTSTRLHRAKMKDLYGDFSVKIHVCHSCHNPECFNPEHLELGTPKFNALQKILSGRKISGENSSNSKMLEKKVVEILSSGKSALQLAKKFEVSTNTIYSIRRGDTWIETYKNTNEEYPIWYVEKINSHWI